MCVKLTTGPLQIGQMLLISPRAEATALRTAGLPHGIVKLLVLLIQVGSDLLAVLPMAVEVLVSLLVDLVMEAGEMGSTYLDL